MVIFGVFPNKGYADPLPLSLIQFLWVMRNVLKRMKDQFSIFIYRVIVKNSSKIGDKSDHDDHNSKNKIRKNLKFYFSFYPVDSASFI